MKTLEAIFEELKPQLDNRISIIQDYFDFTESAECDAAIVGQSTWYAKLIRAEFYRNVDSGMWPYINDSKVTHEIDLLIQRL